MAGGGSVRGSVRLSAVLVVLSLTACGPIGTPPPQHPQITWVGQDERKNKFVYTYWIYPGNTAWNPVYGNYILAKFEHHQWVPVYIGETASLQVELRDGYQHVAEWPCIKRSGATHIHVHTSSADPSARQAEVLNLRRAHAPVCNPLG